MNGSTFFWKFGSSGGGFGVRRWVVSVVRRVPVRLPESLAGLLASVRLRRWSFAVSISRRRGPQRDSAGAAHNDAAPSSMRAVRNPIRFSDGKCSDVRSEEFSGRVEPVVLEDSTHAVGNNTGRTGAV